MITTVASSCRSTKPACAQAARQIREDGIELVAIAAIFSPLDPSHEERAAAILAEECPGAAITLSHRLGRIGLLGARERVPAQRCAEPIWRASR